MRSSWMKHCVAFVAGSFVLAGCGGGNSVVKSVKRSYLGTQAPGDVWEWNITESTFTAKNDTTGYTYDGTAVALPTGFTKLNVQNTTDPGVTVGQSAYALEMPGTALLIKPAGADTKPPIVASSLGTNPPGPTASFNYVVVPKPSWTSTDEAYGHVTFNVTGNSYVGVSKVFRLDDVALPDGNANFTGVNGYMSTTNIPGGGLSTGAMTPSGVCVLDYGPSNGGVIGVKQPDQPVDLSVLGSKSFRGYLINQGKTQCVVCTPNGDGTLHGAGYADPSGAETGTLDGGSGVTISFTSQPNPGEIKLNISVGGGYETVVACVNQVSGKYMLFGFGAGGGTPYNVVLVGQ